MDGNSHRSGWYLAVFDQPFRQRVPRPSTYSALFLWCGFCSYFFSVCRIIEDGITAGLLLRLQADNWLHHHRLSIAGTSSMVDGLPFFSFELLTHFLRFRRSVKRRYLHHTDAGGRQRLGKKYDRSVRSK